MRQMAVSRAQHRIDILTSVQERDVGQNFGIGLGSGLKIAPGFFGIFDLEQQEFSKFGGYLVF
jgi:hypothetical protein